MCVSLQRARTPYTRASVIMMICHLCPLPQNRWKSSSTDLQRPRNQGPKAAVGPAISPPSEILEYDLVEANFHYTRLFELIMIVPTSQRRAVIAENKPYITNYQDNPSLKQHLALPCMQLTAGSMKSCGNTTSLRVLTMFLVVIMADLS